jgi:hypothetical protein
MKTIYKVLQPIKWSGKEYQPGEIIPGAGNFPYIRSLVNQKLLAEVIVIDSVLELPEDQVKLLEETGELPIEVNGREYILKSIQTDTKNVTEESDPEQEEMEENVVEVAQCQYIKTSGEQCKMKANESGYCHHHEQSQKLAGAAK